MFGCFQVCLVLMKLIWLSWMYGDHCAKHWISSLCSANWLRLAKLLPLPHNLLQFQPPLQLRLWFVTPAKTTMFGRNDWDQWKLFLAWLVDYGTFCIREWHQILSLFFRIRTHYSYLIQRHNNGFFFSLSLFATSVSLKTSLYKSLLISAASFCIKLPHIECKFTK